MNTVFIIIVFTLDVKKVCWCLQGCIVNSYKKNYFLLNISALNVYNPSSLLCDTILSV